MSMTTISLYVITNNVRVKDKDTHPGLIPAFEAMKVFVPLTIHHRVPRLYYRIKVTSSLTTSPLKGVQIVHHRVTWFIYQVTWSVTMFPLLAYPGQEKTFEIHFPREPIKYFSFHLSPLNNYLLKVREHNALSSKVLRY